MLSGQQIVLEIFCQVTQAYDKNSLLCKVNLVLKLFHDH